MLDVRFLTRFVHFIGGGPMSQGGLRCGGVSFDRQSAIALIETRQRKTSGAGSSLFSSGGDDPGRCGGLPRLFGSACKRSLLSRPQRGHRDDGVRRYRAPGECRLQVGSICRVDRVRRYSESRRSRRISSSSMSSNHIAFRTAKAAARGRPKSQAKYHMCFSLKIFQRSVGMAGAITNGIGIDLAAQHREDPAGVGKNDGHEDEGGNQHDEQRQMA